MNNTTDDHVNYTPNWNNPSWWDNFYTQNETDRFNIDRDPRYLLKTFERLNRRPPLKILDAGTGISTMPEFIAYLGHHVVAIDISPKAIEIGRQRPVAMDDLQRCLGEIYGQRYRDGKFEYFDRKTREHVNLKTELERLFMPGGEIIAREVGDWTDPALVEKFGTFDIVLNLNGLRAASPELIRQSLQSFYRLLNPGGILIETNINALDRLEIMEQMAVEAGFRLITESWVVFGAEGHKVELNDSEKYTLFGWPTG
jgi:SAM-dependent methyltransferase